MAGLWQSLLQWQSERHLADIASILGLLVSVVGFAMTLVGLVASRKAAQRAEAAARTAANRIKLIDDLVDLTSAIGTLEEIRRFQRTEKWHLLPDRYAALKKALITVKGTNVHLSEAQQTIVQASIATLQSAERSVERALGEGRVPNATRLNNLLAREIDGLSEVLVELKLTAPDRTDGKADKARPSAS